jgi:hypothetical protein
MLDLLELGLESTNAEMKMSMTLGKLCYILWQMLEMSC